MSDTLAVVLPPAASAATGIVQAVSVQLAPALVGAVATVVSLGKGTTSVPLASSAEPSLAILNLSASASPGLKFSGIKGRGQHRVCLIGNPEGNEVTGIAHAGTTLGGTRQRGLRLDHAVVSTRGQLSGVGCCRI